MDPIRLARPPIREAVLDIKVEGIAEVELLHRLAEDFGKSVGMTRTSAIRTGFLEMAIEPDKAITGQARDGGVVGYRVEDQPITRVVQFRNNGFTFSRVGRYESWEQFRDEAMVPTRRFLAVPSIGHVTRLALRYINVIQFPSERVNLDEYLPAAPQVPKELPQFIAGFLSRIVIPIPEDRLTAIVTQSLDESPRPKPSVILDVDVFFQGLLPVEENALAPIFEKIREWKNRIFFAFVNENTVRMHT